MNLRGDESQKKPPNVETEAPGRRMGFVSQLSETDYWCQSLSFLKGMLAKCGSDSHGCLEG